MMNRSVWIITMMAILLSTFSRAQQPKPAYLKDAYTNYFYIGTALNGWQINGKDTASIVLLKQFNSFTPENVMKWGVINPLPDSFRFEMPDKYVEAGKAANAFIVGHALVWHSQLPKYVYFKEPTGDPKNDTLLVDSKTLMGRIKKHIDVVVGRYKGKVNGWDVVNEAMAEDGTFRKSNFYNICGKEFIYQSFRFAHAADPKAELYYNDYNMANAAKRDGVIAMVKEMKSLGVPIDGIGMQGHWSLTKPSLEQIEESIVKFYELGMKVMITELDITVLPNPWDYEGADVSMKFEDRPGVNPYVDSLPDSVQQQLAKRYSDIFTLFIKHQDKISRVTFWGVHDGVSWLNNFPVRGRTNYPLLFDRNYKPKPAFQAVMDVVDRKIN